MCQSNENFCNYTLLKIQYIAKIVEFYVRNVWFCALLYCIGVQLCFLLNSAEFDSARFSHIIYKNSAHCYTARSPTPRFFMSAQILNPRCTVVHSNESQYLLIAPWKRRHLQNLSCRLIKGLGEIGSREEKCKKQFSYTVS